MNKNLSKPGFKTHSRTGLLIAIALMSIFNPHVTARGNSSLNNTTTALLETIRIKNGNIGFWNFDESSGIVANDGSGQAQQGFLRGNSARAAGKSNNAVRLAGIGDYVSFPGMNIGDSDYTVAAWVKTSSRSAYLVGNADSSDLRIAGGRAMFSVYTENGTGFNNLLSRKLVNDNLWHHIVGVRNRNTLLIYVDNVLERSMPISGGANMGYQTLGARHAGDFQEYYNGLLDEVYVFNRAITASEVASLFSAGDAPPVFDTMPPTITISAPAAGASVTGSVTVAAAAADNVGVAGVQFKLDGVNLGIEDATSPFSVSWNTAQISDGNHVLTAVARDAAGNTAVSSAVTVVVNNAVVLPKPVIAAYTASPSVITPNQSATLSWSVSGADSISINQGIGTVSGTNISVKPAATTSYVLTATNSSGSVTASTIVTVNPVNPPSPGINCSSYVAPNGSNTNSGAQNSPWSLAFALSGAKGAIYPGSIVCVTGGTYPGRYVASLNGNSSQPIIFRAVPGQRVVFDGGLAIASLSRDSGSSAPYSSATVAVANAASLQENTIVRIGSEELRIDAVNLQTGNIEVVRGWNGTCSATGFCQNLPSGSSVKTSGAVLDTSGSSYAWFWGLEITNSGHTTRISNQNTSTPGDIDIGGGIVDGCRAGCKYINNVVHNVANGIGSFANENQSEFYGNLSFLNGWEYPYGEGNGGKGHGFYVQNLTAGAPVKKIKDNLSFLNFGYAMQAYTDEGGIHNLQFEGNAFFESGNPVSTGPTYNILMGGGNAPFQGAKFFNNYTYVGQYNGARRGSDVIGWSNSYCASPELRGNYFAAGNFELSFNCSSPMVSGNTFYSNFGRAASFPDNTYYNSRPTGLKTFVRRNEYETGRGTVIVYNWNRSDSVAVDISSLGLTAGQGYVVRDAENYNGAPVASGTYDGGSIVIPMTNTAVSPVFGSVLKQQTHTDREFGAFIIVPTTAP